MANEGIIDVFTAAGLKKPDISILSDQFLAEVRGLKHKNVAAELLAKLLKDKMVVDGEAGGTAHEYVRPTVGRWRPPPGSFGNAKLLFLRAALRITSAFLFAVFAIFRG